MSKLLKATFLIQAILDIVVGALLLIIPGRFLGWLGWAPVEPLLDRLLGAALLAMAWTSIYGFRATSRAQVSILIQMEIIFTTLGAVGILRHLIGYYFPPVVWIVFFALVILAALWILALVQKQKP
jgi:hypothetical protein